MENKPVITMKPVESSNIASCGHCAKTNTLAVTFKNGGTYHYPNVDAETFNAFSSAKSVGKHFHSHIRDNFKGKKV